MNIKALYSSARGNWITPWELYLPMAHYQGQGLKGFPIDTDLAASASNSKCPFYISRRSDTRRVDVRWPFAGFLNAPYGAGLPAFLQKTVNET